MSRRRSTKSATDTSKMSSGNQKRVKLSSNQQNKKSGSKKSADVIPEVDDIEIYEPLFKESFDSDKVIESISLMIEEYPQNVEQCLLKLMLNYFGYGESGQNIQFQSDRNKTTEQIIKQIYQINAQKQMSDFPLMGKNKENKTFMTNLNNFWNKFVKDLSSFDEQFQILEGLIKYLLAFSETKLRTIRFGVCETIKILLKVFTFELEICLTDAAKEKSLNHNKKSDKSKKDSIFMVKAKKYQSLIKLIQGEYLITRFNDTMPEIRQRILECFGFILLSCPDMSEKEKLLSILQKCFRSEKEPSVLASCLSIIELGVNFNSSKDFIKVVKELRDQIYDLAFHHDSNVSIHAFKIIKNNFSTLEVSKKQLQELCKLIFHQSSEITSQACQFMETLYFDNDLIPNDLDSTEFTYVKQTELSKKQLEKLSSILKEVADFDYSFDIKMQRFVQSFYKSTQILFDYQRIIDLVLNQDLDLNNPDDYYKIKVLLRIIYYTIIISKRYADPQKNTDKQLRRFAQQVILSADEVIKIRGNSLIQAFKLRDPILEDLLQIFEECDLDKFFRLEFQSQYNTFLSDIKGILEVSKSAKVIGTSAKLLSIYAHSPEVGAQIRSLIKELSQNLVSSFLEIYSVTKDENSVPSDSQYQMQHILTKLHKIGSCFSLEESLSTLFIERIHQLIHRYLNGVRFNQELIVDSVTILFYVQLWKMTAIIQAEFTESQLAQFFSFRDKLLNNICQLMKYESQYYNSAYIQEKSFQILVELLIVFGNDSLIKTGGLYYKPTKTISQQIFEFIVQKHKNPKTQNVPSTNTKKLISQLTSSPKSDDSGVFSPNKSEDPSTSEKSEAELSDSFILIIGYLIKMLMSSSSLANSSIASKCITYLIQIDDNRINELVKAFLLKCRNKEILTNSEYMNYWKIVDEVIQSLSNQNKNKLAIEFVRLSAKVYHEKQEQLKQEHISKLREKHLKYVIHIILYSTSEKSRYDHLSIATALCNKTYLSIMDYKRVLAFFEMQLKNQASKQKDENGDDKVSETDNKENQIPENKEADLSSTETFIERFRRHLCRLTGLKFRSLERNPLGEIDQNRQRSNQKRSSTKRKYKDEDFEEGEIEIKNNDNDKKNDSNQDESDKNSEQSNQENTTEIISNKDSLSVASADRAYQPLNKLGRKNKKDKRKSQNKRKERNYIGENYSPSEKDDIQEIIDGHKATKKSYKAQSSISV